LFSRYRLGFLIQRTVVVEVLNLPFSDLRIKVGVNKAETEIKISFTGVESAGLADVEPSDLLYHRRDLIEVNRHTPIHYVDGHDNVHDDSQERPAVGVEGRSGVVGQRYFLAELIQPFNFIFESLIL